MNHFSHVKEYVRELFVGAYWLQKWFPFESLPNYTNF